MIQDIGDLYFDNQYKNKSPELKDCVLVFRGKEVLLKQQDDRITYLTYQEIVEFYQEQGKEVPALIYLFALEERSYYLLQDEVTVQGFMFYKMFETRKMAPKEEVLVAATGWHLYNWYRTNHYCGVCGKIMHHDAKERMMRCPECGNMVFPRIVPAVIVALTDGDRIMMTKYAGREYTRYALIAGFTEIGETVEETVRREVLEEVGVHVKNITYYKSQPWGYDSDLLLGYFCELDGSAAISMDQNELSVAEWMDYKDMPDYHEGLSLTEEMMNTFKRQREKMHEQD